MPAISRIKEKAGEKEEGGREGGKQKEMPSMSHYLVLYLSFCMGTLIIDYLFGGLAQRENVII